MKEHVKYWGLLWEQENRLDGKTVHLIYDNGKPAFFQSRSSARIYRDENYGYIKTRKDLRTEPHCWRLPKIVRISQIFYEVVK